MEQRPNEDQHDADKTADRRPESHFSLGMECKRALDGFSHKLRTPLTTVIGLSETVLFRDTLDEATRRQFLEKIHDQAVRACTILDELRELTKLGSAEHGFSMEQIDLLVSVAEAVQSVVQSAEMKGLGLIINTPQDPVWINGDGNSLKLLLLNLLENSIRYTEYGGQVELSVETSDGRVLLRIADDGIGIAAEEQHLVFDLFYRSPRGKEHAPRGTGLGLALVKQIAGLHGGDVSMTSAPDMGTSIIVSLPQHK